MPPRSLERTCRSRTRRPVRIPFILIAVAGVARGYHARRPLARARARHVIRRRGTAPTAAAADSDAADGARWTLRLNLGREPGTGMAAAFGASGARLVLRDDGGLGQPLDAAPDKHGRFRLPALSGCELAADDAATRDAWAAAIRGAIVAPG